jgi:hypothetical protein
MGIDHAAVYATAFAATIPDKRVVTATVTPHAHGLEPAPGSARPLPRTRRSRPATRPSASSSRSSIFPSRSPSSGSGSGSGCYTKAWCGCCWGTAPRPAAATPSSRRAPRAAARTLAPSKKALDTPLSPPPLDDEPGPASRRSSTYPDRTTTRKPGPASRTQHAGKLHRGSPTRLGCAHAVIMTWPHRSI